jgi:hypothetical protein
LSNEAAKDGIDSIPERERLRRTGVGINIPSIAHPTSRYDTSLLLSTAMEQFFTPTRRLQNEWESSPWADDPFNYTEVVALKCRPVEEFLNYDWDWDWDWDFEALLLSGDVC